MKKTNTIIWAALLILLLPGWVNAQHEFITTWQTDDGTITVPVSGTDFHMAWTNLDNPGQGDGALSNLTYGPEITGLTIGDTYRIEITGDYHRIFFNNYGDILMIQTIEQWGTTQWSTMERAFTGCRNLRINASDAPDLSNVTTMSQMFEGARTMNDPIGHWDVSNVTHMSKMFYQAQRFNQDISNWDVSNVTNMSYMFHIAGDFNQDISNWDVSSVTNFEAIFFNAFDFNQNLGDWDISSAQNMISMLQGCGMSTSNYDSTIIGWSLLPNPPDVYIHVDGMTFCTAESAREKLINLHSWVFDGDSRDCNKEAFITTWNIQSDNEQIEIPTNGTGYNYTVLWGDGTSDRNVTGNVTHKYATAGTYQVTIYGDFPAIYFNNTGDKDKITSIDSWGNIQWQSMNSAFEGCTNLTYSLTYQDDDAPDLSNVTDMSYMFAGASSINGYFGSWNTSTVTDMSYLFKNATSFNGGVRNWDVSNVTTMEGMFSGASAYNRQDAYYWTPENLVNASYMFENATTYRYSIFRYADNLQNMEGMFKGASAFEGPIYLNLKTSVTNMKDMLKNATSFDRYIGSWNISNVTNMEGMLSGSGLSKENYGRALQDWSEKTLQSGVTLGADGLEYCAGRVERQTLIDTYGWNFVGDTENCPVFVNIPDANFKSRLVTICDNNGDNEIDETEAAGISTHLYAKNLNIADLTGIEAFVNITQLTIEGNLITSLDLSNNLALTDVNARNCQLSNLNLGNNTVIEFFRADQNNLTSVDLSNYTSLTTIDLSENQLTSIQLPSTSTLGTLYLDDNQLESIDLTGITSVTRLDLSKNALTGIDVSPVTALEILTLHTNNLSSVVFGSNTMLTSLFMNNNPLTSVDISGLTGLTQLRINNTSITTIDVSQNIKLTSLNAEISNLSSLDVSNNTELADLRIDNTEVSALDLSNNQKLRLLSASGAKLVELDLSGIPVLDEIFLDGNNLQSLNVTSGNTSQEDFVATNNPNLFCVEVSDVTHFETNFPNGLDPQASYSLNCNIDPEDISLSNHSLNENNAIGDLIGAFSTTDADADDTHTYSLVLGTGDSDNASFTIDGADLKAAEVFDFETKSSYSIRVQTDDGNGGTFQKNFNITINDINEAPTAIALSASTINENNAAGDVVGSFSTTDADAGDTHTYTLVAGNGDTDNSSFTVSGADLQAAEVFDFETKASYSIRVQTDDGKGGTFEKVFTITVTKVNEAPQAISLSTSTINENNAIGDVIGSFSTTDADAGDSHTYTLVAGNGDTDNSSFTVSGADLQAAEVFDFETKASYSIRVQTDDGKGGTFQETFTISIGDVDESANTAPTALTLSNSTIDENNSEGDVIGTFTTTDTDGSDTHTYTLVAGNGDTDNTSFTISGVDLQAAEVFDFETKASYSIRVQSDDGNGGTYQEAFTISIGDVDESANDAPTALTLSNSTIDENNSAGDVIGTFTTTDTDGSDTHTYTLIAGTGDTDNTSFTIAGTDLLAAAVFDFETKSSYSIRVQTDDGNGGTFQETFTISINDVDEKQEQTITFDAIEDQIFEKGSVTLSPSASSGLEISLKVLSGPATVDGMTIVFEDLGEVTIEASQAGDADYLPATPITQSFQIVTVLSNQEDLKDNGIILHPNPVVDYLHIDTRHQVNTLSITDLKGVTHFTIDNYRGEKLDLSFLKSGIYFIQLKGEEGNMVRKFFKN